MPIAVSERLVMLMIGRLRRADSRAVMLPTATGLLLVRTDYSDDRAWHAALSAATAVYDVDDCERMDATAAGGVPALSNLTPEEGQRPCTRFGTGQPFLSPTGSPPFARETVTTTSGQFPPSEGGRSSRRMRDGCTLPVWGSLLTTLGPG